MSDDSINVAKQMCETDILLFCSRRIAQLNNKCKVINSKKQPQKRQKTLFQKKKSFILLTNSKFLDKKMDI
jgi:hypothetical protein